MRERIELPAIVLVAALAIMVLFARGLSQPRNGQVNDSQITTHVNAKLASDVGPSGAANVHVSTTNGVVTLIGEVENPELKHRAETVTASVLGVVMVSNNLQVASDSESVVY